METAGGVSSVGTPYQYNINNVYLINPLEFNPLLYLLLQVGVRLNDRHLLAGGWERTHVDNGFRYSRNQVGRWGIGLGAISERYAL